MAEPRAGDLVDADRPAGPGQVALDDDHRHAAGLLGAGHLEGLVVGGDQHDALDALAAQVVDRVGQLLARDVAAG